MQFGTLLRKLAKPCSTAPWHRGVTSSDAAESPFSSTAWKVWHEWSWHQGQEGHGCTSASSCPEAAELHKIHVLIITTTIIITITRPWDGKMSVCLSWFFTVMISRFCCQTTTRGGSTLVMHRADVHLPHVHVGCLWLEEPERARSAFICHTSHSIQQCRIKGQRSDYWVLNIF